jgi:hypothetical protein
MRLTVGSLPSAVYWRRRAIVLTIVLSVIFVFVYACSNGPGDRKKTAQNNTLPTPSSHPSASASATTAATASMPTTPGGRTSPPPSGPGAQPPPFTGSQTCTDQELQVTPVPQPADAPMGGTIQLTLKIKNVGKRTCNRDVGADFQEMRIVRGAEKVWSSDDCNPTRGSDVRPFAPNFERAYSITWNGKTSSKCDGKRAIGRPPAGGDYQLYGRLGTKLSTAVALTLN